MKKLLAFLLSLCLLGTLAACNGSADPGASGSPAPGVSGPAAPGTSGSPAPSAANAPREDDPTEAYAQEFAQAVVGLDADAALFTVNGEIVTTDYFLYWLSYDCQYYDFMFSSFGGSLNFEEEVEAGVTVGEFLKRDAQRMTALYVTLEQKAAENGCSVSAEQREDWEQTKAGYREELGEDGYAGSMRQQGLSERLFDRIGQVGYLYENLKLQLVPEPSKEELDAYTAENDTYKAKHILILSAKEGEDGTVSLSTGGTPLNEDGTAFTGTAQEFNEKALAKVKDILARIDAAADPMNTFDTLMHEYSEDTGLAANPDGYVFSSGQMVEPFENATKALAYDAYTAEPVESTFGWHIILRLAPAEECREAKMGEIVDGWIEEMDITDATPEYEALDSASFFEKYTVYGETIYEQWQEQQAAASGAPEQGG